LLKFLAFLAVLVAISVFW